MKITDLKANQAVHCKTHEEAKRVLRLAHEAGMKWCTNESYIENDNWNYYQDKICYNFTKGSVADIPYYKSEGFEIIPSEKITDMENKTEFFEERIMEVSEDGTTWYTRVVFRKKNGRYIAWINATTVEEAKKVAAVVTWKLAREIKPKPKYVPFTFEDAEEFMNKTVIAKDKSRYGVITYAKDEVVVIGRSSRSYKWLFDEFTFIDGSPCGKEVEE